MKRIIYLALLSALAFQSMGCRTRQEQEQVAITDYCSLADSALSGIPEEYRQKMENVLKHYESAEDSLKYKAALFLISNMPGHQSYTGTLVEEYNCRLDSLISSMTMDTAHFYRDVERLSNAVAKLSKAYSRSSFERKEDYELLSADFLIRNIDEAFELWENGNWARHLEFGDFCEYVLPYKTDDDYVLEAGWRDAVSSQIDSSTIKSLASLAFSSEMEHSSFRAAQIIASFLMDKLKYDYRVTPTRSPAVWKMSLKTRLPYGVCDDFCEIGSLYMRSIGIPSAVDYTPQWPFRSSGHCFNDIIMNNGLAKSFAGCCQNPELLHEVDHQMAKVYRRTYAVNRDVREILSKERFVPRFMRYPFFKDVTSEFMRTSDIDIEPECGHFSGTCYLAVFNDKEWVPICFGKRTGEKYHFKDVGRGIVYLPVRCTMSGVKPVSEPFLLDGRGSVHILKASKDQYDSASLTRKFYLERWIHMYVSRLIGGRFQWADKPDFSDAVTVHTVNKWSIIPDSVIIESPSPHRYWRYLAPDGADGNIAEIEFFESGYDHQVKGTIIGTDGTYFPDRPETGKEAVFDGNPLTFFNAPKGKTDVYVGMDFGQPVAISKIKYLPRNDDNNISPGDLYELFWWEDGSWRSLGRKRADSYELRYDGIPKNALLLLRDLTKGKEERIFTLENGKQVWW